VTITVHNVGRDIADIGLNFPKNDWLGEHIITDTTPACKRNDVLGDKWLDCGEIKPGDTVTITIHAYPKDTGNFDYTMVLADRWNNQIQFIQDSHGNDMEFSFSETVIPG